MEKNNPMSRFYKIYIPVSVVSIIILRLSGVFYSITATDVLWMHSYLPVALYYIRDIAECIFLSVAFSGIVFSVYHGEKRDWRNSFLIFVFLLLIDRAASFLIDFLSGDIKGAEFVALIWLIIRYFIYFAMMIAVLLVAIIMYKKYELYEGTTKSRKYEAGRVIIVSACIMLLFFILSLSLNVFSFLFEVGFKPLHEETLSIIGDYLYIVVTRGFGLVLFSYLFNWWFKGK